MLLSGAPVEKPSKSDSVVLSSLDTRSQNFKQSSIKVEEKRNCECCAII